jgi:excisionase family DNA binding protein
MNTTAGKEIEPFVDASKAAEFLVITRRRVLEMARAGEIPAHAIGDGKRKMWRFRLSELAEALVARSPAAKSGSKVSSTPAVPGNRIGGTR